MDELDALRQRRLQEMQQENLQQQQMEQQISEAETLVKMKMTKEAVERYSTLKSMHPEKAIQILVLLAQLIQSNKIDIIDDKNLKLLLSKITPEKREFNIRRV